jgi:predicted permease
MPDWKNLVRERLALLHLRPDAESDLADELASHLEDRYNELCSAGAGEEEACHAALAELDDVYPLHTDPRAQRQPKYDAVVSGDARAGNWLADMWRDLRYGLRTFRKSPGFSVFVVGTLALGIGANTTVFSLIETLVLNPLPVRNAAELMAVSEIESRDSSNHAVPFPISYPDLKDYQQRNQVFRSLAGYTANRVITLQGNSGSERIFAELVTHNYFSTLGVTPLKGRFFAPQEETGSGAHPVAVMSYGTWNARFGARQDIVGETVRLNGLQFTIVGVAPPHFIGVNAIFGPDFWIPVTMAETLFPNDLRNALTDRGRALVTGVARLNPGVAQPKAQAEVETLASALAREYPTAHQGHSVTVRPIRDVVFGSSGGGVSNARSVMLAGAVLLAVVALVLLIACSNVANLLLARSAARRQEMAVRLALGASRRRLVRQLLTESLIFGVLSGVLGLFVGFEGLQVLFGRLPAAANFAAPRLDANVFLFALFVSLATALLFGIVPAFQSSRGDVAESLKQEARTMGRSARRVTIANALIVGQVAFSFLLLVTAALFLRSLGRAYAMDPGFQTARLALFMTSPAQDGYSKPQTKAFYRTVRERLSSVPGIEAASWASNLPLWSRPVNGLDVEGRQRATESDHVRAVVTTVDLDYFGTAGIRIERGREFTVSDREASTPVAIVNEKMAHDFWPAGALGKRVQMPGEKQMRQIVGVARNANYTNWGEPQQYCVYVPLEQNYSDAMTLYVRTSRDPREIITSVRREVNAIAPAILLSFIRTGSDIVDGGLFQAKIAVGLLTVFGLLALGLASIGLYGILAYSVRLRKREIGVRMALGASPSSVRKLVMKQGLSLVAAGIAIGLIASVVAGRLLRGMLFDVGAMDPVSVAAAAVALSAIALVACYLPARSATRVDPLTALHES